MAVTVLPPAGLGEGQMAAVSAAEAALLAFLREAQDVGYLGSPPMGADLEGCLAFVFLGADVSVYEYSRERGFFDPPGGFEFEHKRVDAAPLPPLRAPRSMRNGESRVGLGDWKYCWRVWYR